MPGADETGDGSQLRPDQDYIRFLADGRFMLLRPRGSGRCFFPPRIAEPGSGDVNLEWVEASGRGHVYSTTVVRQRPPARDYNVVLVDLDDGIRMMSRVDGMPPEHVHIGMAVQAEIVVEEDGPKVVFRPQAGHAPNA